MEAPFSSEATTALETEPVSPTLSKLGCGKRCWGRSGSRRVLGVLASLRREVAKDLGSGPSQQPSQGSLRGGVLSSTINICQSLNLG